MDIVFSGREAIGGGGGPPSSSIGDSFLYSCCCWEGGCCIDFCAFDAFICFCCSCKWSCCCSYNNRCFSCCSCCWCNNWFGVGGGAVGVIRCGDEGSFWFAVVGDGKRICCWGCAPLLPWWWWCCLAGGTGVALVLLLFELKGGGGVGVLWVGCNDEPDCWLLGTWDEYADDIWLGDIENDPDGRGDGSVEGDGELPLPSPCLSNISVMNLSCWWPPFFELCS